MAVYENRYPYAEGGDVRARISWDGGESWEPELYILSVGHGYAGSAAGKDGTIIERRSTLAAKLYASLKDKNLDVFFDQERLDVGKEWRAELLEDLANSQHLVALWSDAAKQFEWVRHEITRFQILSEEVPDGAPPRHILLLNLKG